VFVMFFVLVGIVVEWEYYCDLFGRGVFECVDYD